MPAIATASHIDATRVTSVTRSAVVKSSHTGLKKASPPASNGHQEPRLDSLTSLRFFAASMILLLHLSQLFDFNQHTCLEGLALWQGVSFFFVLSGFILAYVYPKIETPAQSNQFLLARFARIWPTHFAAFALTILLVPKVLSIANVVPVAVANLCMVQVWAFKPALSESFNSVSWTISIELFFYLCFPFLIKDFSKGFKTRWIAATALSLSCVLLCMVPVLQGCGAGAMPPSLYLGENPLCRLLEFTLGIVVCWFFRNRPLPAAIGKAQATCLEVLALSAIAAAVSLSNIWPAASATGALSVVRSWAIDMGGAPAYGALILLIASERGALSQFLSKRIFVKLGEISFSLYMYHLSILYVMLRFQSSFANLPGFVLPAIAVLACLIVSHLNFELIETPCRKWILNSSKKLRELADSCVPAQLFMDDLTFFPPFPEPNSLVGKILGRPLAVSGLSIDELIFSPPMPGAGALLSPSGKLVAGFAKQTNWFDDLMFSPPVPDAQNVRKAFSQERLWLDDLIFSPPVPGDGFRRAPRVERSLMHGIPAMTSVPSPGEVDRELSRNPLQAASREKSRQTWAVAELVVLTLIVSWLNVQFRFIPVSAAQRIESHSVPTTRDITFGGKFKLRGLKLSRKTDGLYLDAVWQSVGSQKLRYVNAIHVIDANGKTLATKIYPQDTFNRSVSAGKIWEDKLYLRQDELKNALRIGLSLYDPPDGEPLRADKGVTDGNNVRLLLAIP